MMAKTMVRVATDRRVVLSGLLTWLIPFLVSFAFFDRSGRPVIPMGTFKSLMIVIGACVGAALLGRISKRVELSREAAGIIGMEWLLINLGMDLLILIPMTKMPLPEYLGEIGLRYLLIPVLAVAMSVSSSRRADA